ncbi:hypothetical protein QQS21_009367 [Conoideocrella luteorostrata]|uniref:Uncharacterized protein n=1 Tax=Conoideocrella luteorostrata TaxID=1105319 RepID=A0AAJ0CHZ5_9HYPO|nr:hypothetical protein QQS21_009367 [Conoideocrella luteorostrata]
MAKSYELYDDKAWERGEHMFEALRDAQGSEGFYQEITNFVTKHQNLAKCNFSEIGYLGMQNEQKDDDGGLGIQRSPAGTLFDNSSARQLPSTYPGPFKLRWDDFRLRNILVGLDRHIVALGDRRLLSCLHGTQVLGV